MNIVKKHVVELGALVHGGNHEPGLVVDRRNIDDRDIGLGRELLIIYPNNRIAWETEKWHARNLRRMADGPISRESAKKLIGNMIARQHRVMNANQNNLKHMKHRNVTMT